MSVGYKTKRLVWKRDGGRCFYCGVSLTWDTKTVDHVIPKSKGGPHRAWNIVICCLSCNQLKGDSRPNTEHLDIVLRWKIAHESRISVEKAICLAKNIGDDIEAQRLIKLREDILTVIHSPNPQKLHLTLVA